MTDVCLILEGTYPYVTGGVSTWTHDLIKAQKDLTFHLVCLLPKTSPKILKYTLPPNVKGITVVTLQDLPDTLTKITKEQKEEFFKSIEMPLLRLQHHPKLSELNKIIHAFKAAQQPLGADVLLNSDESWNMLLRMYRSTMADSSFLNFYWSWRSLLSGFYSILLAELPEAKVYHALCTGYAGLFLARAHLETGKPCIITEHGIYTNERRIEITLADWLYDEINMDLSVDKPIYERDLKDYWIDTFYGYSKLCYDASDVIITLFDGNQEFQLADGADPAKLKVIPNGADYAHLSKIAKNPDHPPTIALIGRVVPIKDVKTFIHAVADLKEKLPNIRSYIIGPTDEDPEYFKECLELANNLHLGESLTFTGKVSIETYLPSIDVVVLTSISESQPLVILEGGCLGIPCATTDVGSCKELIFGKASESPPIGQAGVICQLANPQSFAEGIYDLLTQPDFYASCSFNIQERVKLHYNAVDQQRIYHDLYEELMREPAWQA